jgi:hypothetical protein
MSRDRDLCEKPLANCLARGFHELVLQLESLFHTLLKVGNAPDELLRGEC